MAKGTPPQIKHAHRVVLRDALGVCTDAGHCSHDRFQPAPEVAAADQLGFCARRPGHFKWDSFPSRRVGAIRLMRPVGPKFHGTVCQTMLHFVNGRNDSLSGPEQELRYAVTHASISIFGHRPPTPRVSPGGPSDD